ncbi:(R)-mandelonitrile lyase 3 [Cucumis sativus]|uniref:(R)-mandelonitrile lyase n=1 Tax=Cucumis sativus TaxID=3659 RepID=A0A0A0LMB8_CUCSA|nr:(R)-mandelonitrile lyase 3 [Cucumis sativus]KGN61116.1 hypothetical protein Csa_021230 [Cucumis sativus]
MEYSIATFLPLILISIEFLSSHAIPNQDISYMKFVHNANDQPIQEKYDYIVIGGGTTGCPLATTLSSKFSVLLLERGSDPNTYPFVLNEETLSYTFILDDDGQNPIQRFVSEDGVENIRGRVLGGGSMVNAGFYSRGHQEFFETAGVDWDMELVEKAYEWVEETLVSRPNLTAWQAAFRNTLLEGGVVPDNGFDLRHLVGTKIGGSIFDNKGNRHGAVELLNKANPKNLKVVIQATVQRIIFKGLSAVGVLYSDSKGKLHTALIHKKGEIFLSAGAIGSPQLLLLSGIGPKSYLSSLKLHLVHHQPHVGQYMTDNPRFSRSIIFPFQLLASTAQVVGTLEKNIHLQSLASPLPFFPLPSYGLLPPQSTSITSSLVIIVGKFSNVSSKGWLHLNNSSTDAKENPIVRFNYYSQHGDISRCVSGVRKVEDLLKTQTMERIKTQDLEGNKGFQFMELPMPENLWNDSSVEEYCKNTVATYWHYHGGCLVGKVVDDNYKVIGIKNLRVVDGSTFSDSPGTNPMATLMMLGRYVGLKVLQQRSS